MTRTQANRAPPAQRTQAATRADRTAAGTALAAPPAGHDPECVCVSLRRAARAFSQLYDEALAPAGLRITQFSLLRAIERMAPASISDLAEAQVLDRSTLSRNLAPLERDGLVEQAPGVDRRVSEVRLTAAGRAAIARALPLWNKVQKRLHASLDAGALAQLQAWQVQAQAAATRGAASRR